MRHDWKVAAEVRSFADRPDIPASPAERLHALKQDGLTIEFESMPRTTRAICVPALGGEFWAVNGDYDVDLDRLRVIGGHLIVDHGKPLRDPAALRARNIQVETIHLST